VSREVSCYVLPWSAVASRCAAPARDLPATWFTVGVPARTGRLKMPSHVHAHLDFLLLAMIRQEPRDAHSVRRELRERFGARSTPSPQAVYSRLHYLHRNRLIRPLPTDPRRYLLTVSGRRSVATRTRERSPRPSYNGANATNKQRTPPPRRFRVAFGSRRQPGCCDSGRGGRSCSARRGRGGLWCAARRIQR
jgi:DNA-binding PadR family transcriptional regulator